MKKNNNLQRFGCLLVVLIGVLCLNMCGGIFFPLPYASLAPFEGKVIDEETREPIEGAVVLAVYYFTAYTIAGSNSYVENGQETVTDKNGRFKLPRTRRWFALHRGYPEGKLVIFKPGYGVFPDHRKSQAVGENKSWPPPGKYIVYELPRLKNMEERKTVHLRTYSEISYEKKKNYIRLYNEERINLGFSPTKIIPKKGE